MKNRKKTLSRALKSLAVASAMGFTASAAAQMELSTDGTGDVLIFPYYSVSGGEWTEFAIHNGSDHSKALGLRVREGLGGNDAIDFHIYLAAGQTFEGRLYYGEMGGAEIGGKIGVCTVPQLTDQRGEYAFQEVFPYLYDDDSFPSVERSLTGTIEVIELGQWPSESIGGWDANNISDCNWLLSAWSPGGSEVWRDDPTKYALDWTPGGLSGEAVLHAYTDEAYQLSREIDVPPIVLQGFAKEGKKAEYHQMMGLRGNAPWPAGNLRNGTHQFTAPRFGDEVMEAQNGLQAVSALLAVTEARVRAPMTNVYPESHSLLVTFPTKFLHTEADAAEATSPFTTLWDPDASTACESVWLSNAESIWPSADPEASEVTLCGATNVLGYGGGYGLYADDWVKVDAPEIFEYPYSLSFAYDALSASSAERTIYVVDQSGKQHPVTGMPAYVLPISASGPSEAELKWGADPMELVSPMAAVAPDPDSGSGPDPDSGSSPDPDSGSSPDPDSDPSPDTDPDPDPSPDPDPEFRLLLEGPQEGESYSGVGTLRGWAIAEEGIERVDIYIDDDFYQSAPYGGQRADVEATYPEIADARNSGFALAFSYNILSKGSHTISAVAVTTQGRSKTVDADFTVTKFHKNRIRPTDEVSLDGATCSVSGEEVSLFDALIDGRTYDISLEWRTGDQGFEIESIE